MKKLSKKILLITLIITLFLITMPSVSAAENTANLGNLITNAPENSVVELGEGTYTNNVTNINIEKNITIIGKGADKTIIDANKAGQIFNIQYARTLTLINLTLINGNAFDGGAIENRGGTLKITNCNFANNTATGWGGAIYNYGNGSIIENCIFINNSADYGGALYIRTNSNYITVNNCTFQNNSALNYEGGGIYSIGSDYVTVTNSTFINNSASNTGGGGIHNTGGDYFNVINCIFINNIAKGPYGNGGAINIAFENFVGRPKGNYCSVINCTFINNTADRFGGAIMADYANNCTVLNSNFINNTALIAGSSIVVGASQNFSLRNSTFINNKRSYVLFIYGDNAIIQGCDIYNNTHGIKIGPYSNVKVNYNRIFNNTNATGYNLEDDGINTNLNFNWWGDNHPKVNGTLDNYFIMNVTNLTSLGSNGTVTFDYTFRLNTDETADNSLLPYFVNNVYTNVTDGIVTSFDARYDRPFDVTVNNNGNVLYTFITDNEVQTLEGIATILDPVDPVDPIGPVDPVDPINPVDPVVPDNDNNQTINNPTASAVMKETGIPIIAILLVLLSSLGLVTRKK